MNILIFGNPLLEFDNLPLRLKPRLEEAFPDINFIETDPADNLRPENKELIIIDTAEGIKDVKTLTDIESIENSPTYSLHDFDLGIALKLLKKIGQLEKATIFCVPPNGDEKDIFDQLKDKIKRLPR